MRSLRMQNCDISNGLLAHRVSWSPVHSAMCDTYDSTIEYSYDHGGAMARLNRRARIQRILNPTFRVPGLVTEGKHTFTIVKLELDAEMT